MTVHDTTKDYAVITGASGELGAKLAHRLLEKGWQVELWSRNRSERTNELLSSYVSTAHWQEVDVTDTATIKKALSSRSNGGQLRLLVNNAGLLHQGLFPSGAIRHRARIHHRSDGQRQSAWPTARY